MEAKRFLTILEVSQKQAYIFGSNKVKDNILNSAVIAYALSPEYLQKSLLEIRYCDEKNMVYSGGGHTILEFSDRETAKRAVSRLTGRIYRDFDGLSVFAKTIEYDEKKNAIENLKELTKALEKKKSVRSSAFHQESYGIEKIDVNTLEPESADRISEEKRLLMKAEAGENRKYYPEGYEVTDKFEELGGEKNENNFIAVVHIDGNGMGKRVEHLYEKLSELKLSWEEVKNRLRKFSEEIDQDFKDSFKQMCLRVGLALENGSLKDKLSLKGKKFPIRRIITAGDDICFVTEGRIGLECARIFIEELNQRKNHLEAELGIGENYTACAGAAIVHVKYPFYRAYHLAELLCDRAKRFGAFLSEADNGACVSSIDWHIEYGEIGDALSEIRKEYITADGNELMMRPYIISAPEEIIGVHRERVFENFRKGMICLLQNEENYGIGKIKELRAALKQGEIPAKNFLRFNRMENMLSGHAAIKKEGEAFDLLKLFSGEKKEINAFLLSPAYQGDDKKHSFLFDMIEIMDTYIAVEGGTD